MKTKFIFLSLALFVHFSSCLAQKHDYIWIFGDSCGIDFQNLNNPMPFIANVVNPMENSNSFSDKNGNLLFYINSSNYNFNYYINIYNSLQILMENGDSIASDISETQGTIFIPFPNDSNKFYVFHIQHGVPPNALQGNSLYYSVIDLSFNGGLGKVTTKNNLLLADSMQEKLTAVKHGNGRDWWVITRLVNSDKFNIYYISPSGISLPIKQSIGPFIPGYPTSLDFCYYPGQMKISNQGDKLVLVNLNGEAALFDFNRCTGKFDNYINLESATGGTCTGYYGCSFSESGNRLYISTFDVLYQYDITDSLIANTKTLIWNDNSDDPYLMQHQLGPDGKIYLSSKCTNPNLSSHISNFNLSVIKNPDNLGLACNFTPYSFNLIGGHSTGGLPNLPNYILGKLIGGGCDSINTSAYSIYQPISLTIYPNPASDYLNVESSGELKIIGVEIMNIHGRMIESRKINKTQQTIDLSNLSVGVYILKVQTEKGFEIRKIIKQ